MGLNLRIQATIKRFPIARHKLSLDARMFLKGYFPISRLNNTPEEIEKIWREHYPNHKNEKPDSGKFSEYLYGATQTIYRNIMDKKIKEALVLMRIPHAYCLGAECYGDYEIIKTEIK